VLLAAYYARVPALAATVLVFVGVSRLAHALQDATRGAGVGPRALDGNVSEFGELVVYYLLALYVRDRAWASAAASAEQGGAALVMAERGVPDGRPSPVAGLGAVAAAWRARGASVGRTSSGWRPRALRPAPLVARYLRCPESRC